MKDAVKRVKQEPKVDSQVRQYGEHFTFILSIILSLVSL